MVNHWYSQQKTVLDRMIPQQTLFSQPDLSSDDTFQTFQNITVRHLFTQNNLAFSCVSSVNNFILSNRLIFGYVDTTVNPWFYQQITVFRYEDSTVNHLFSQTDWICGLGYKDFNNLVALTHWWLPNKIIRHVYKKKFFRFLSRLVRICIQSFEKMLKWAKKNSSKNNY